MTVFSSISSFPLRKRSKGEERCSLGAVCSLLTSLKETLQICAIGAWENWGCNLAEMRLEVRERGLGAWPRVRLAFLTSAERLWWRLAPSATATWLELRVRKA